MSLDDLIEKARALPPMAPKQQEAQRQSMARGLRPFGRREFIEGLEEASREVQAWPEWKQKQLQVTLDSHRPATKVKTMKRSQYDAELDALQTKLRWEESDLADTLKEMYQYQDRVKDIITKGNDLSDLSACSTSMFDLQRQAKETAEQLQDIYDRLRWLSKNVEIED